MRLKGKFSLVSLIFLILTSVLFLWGCNLQGEALSFDTIENEYSTIGEESLRVYKPRLVVITKSEDVQALEDLIYPDTLEYLKGLDFREYFAIAVFQGSQGSTGYDIEVKKVVNQGNLIKVYADFTTPDPNEPVGPMHTLPRQVIKIKRGDLQGRFKFQLIVKGRVKARQDGVNLD